MAVNNFSTPFLKSNYVEKTSADGKEVKTRERVIYDRDGDGKLTAEAKWSLEHLQKEIVRREYRETKADREAFDESFVNMDPEYVFKRKPNQRLKWLEKAFKALFENKIKANAVYDLVSHAKFVEGVNQSIGEGIFEHLEKNIGFFTPRQQKYFLSSRFPLYKRHAIMTVLESDEEQEDYKPAARPMKDEDKPAWLLAQERERQRKKDEEREKRLARLKERDKEARGGRSRSRSRSRQRSRSRSSGSGSAASGTKPPPSRDKGEGNGPPPPNRPRPNDVPKFGPGGKPKVERRIDPADGNMYSLAEFMAEYGGTKDEPPSQWVKSKNTSFFYNE